MSEIEEVQGCCPLDCQDTCAWVATVKDGVVTKVRGAKNHPFTRGGLCAKVRDYEKRTYGEERLLHPLVRIGAKGGSQFQRIGWDEAFSLIAGKFVSIIERYGAQALMPYHYLGSMGMAQRHALMRLFNALGSSQLHGDICGAPGFALGAEGHPIGFDWEEVVQSELIVLWGANLLSTCHHHWHFVKQAQRRGARVISIDPRVTPTTEQSDTHITIRPGTDSLLAAGIVQVMIAEGFLTAESIGRYASDADSFRHYVERCSPDVVSAACDIPVAVVQTLARDIARARPAVFRCGIGPQQSVQGDALVRTLSALAILSGQDQLPGGGLFVAEFPVLHEDRAAAEHLSPGHRRSLDMTRLATNLSDSSMAPPVKALMCWNTNPAVVLSDSGTVKNALAREDLFTVVVEHFVTDTARYADIVLPSTTQLEHFDLLGSWGHAYVTVNHPAIKPRGEARTHGEIMRGLAAALGLTQPELTATDRQIALSALDDSTDVDELLSRGWLQSTRSRVALEPRSLRFSSEFRPPVKTDRFQLLTPKAHHFLNSSFANMPRHRAAEGGPFLEINPDDADELALAEGSLVWVENSQGRVRASIRRVDGMHRKVVALPGKWWGKDDPAGAVSNQLTPSVWSAMGQPAFNDTYVAIVADSRA